MARAIWTGAISFGLVSIPVGLFSATEDHTIHFHQFERGTSDRIRYQRVNERTGKEVEYSDIVKGKDVGGGDHVLVEPDELADIAPGRSRTIDIETFVDLDDIDPIFFQKTYWLAPTDDQYARPYALLREAMTRTNRAGIATFVMRGKEYLTALRADGDVLALETLFFADEIRDRSALDIPGGAKPKGKELEMATGLIEAMSGEWKPDEFRDTYTERVEKLIEDKRKGREIVTEAEPPEPTAMTDLIAALERSVDDARGGKKSKKASSNGTPDLSELSKADLTKMARELDVKGRSSMSRAELEKAVAEASGGSERRKKAS
ncbi:Ku protein [Pseudonocardia zijingensis]|jgi:DNA end-binding protein Ku|uniref:Non-homologous end joining protein Ku n=1 Tax=Pseudonocardia zijingensis TaxID=153376 RepID=A0ABP3YLK2_9PSEU